MKIFIIELDSLKKIDKTTVRVFITSENQDICKVFSAGNEIERQLAKKLLPLNKQNEIEQWAEFMLEQHKTNNKNYMLCEVDASVSNEYIIEHIMEIKNIEEYLIEF